MADTPARYKPDWALRAIIFVSCWLVASINIGVVVMAFKISLLILLLMPATLGLALAALILAREDW